MAFKVLIVDDIEVNRLVLQFIVEQLSCESHLAENGQQAFELFQNQAFDLILMDIHMPICDGIEATQKIRSFETHRQSLRTKIYAVTADNTWVIKQTTMEAGFDGLLIKPVTLDTMRAIVKPLTDQAT